MLRHPAFGSLAIALLAVQAGPGSPMAGPPVTNGRIAFIQGCCAEWIVHSVSPDGSGETELTNAWRYEFASSPAWSPDGSMLAFSAFSTRPGWHGREIGVVNADGTNIHALTHTRIAEMDPEWTPDGTRLIFVRGGDLLSMATDGSDRVRLTATRRAESDPEFSPDGTRILFASTVDDRRRDLFTMSPDGTGRVRLAKSPRWEMQPHWNATGDAIFFTATVKIGPMDYDHNLWSVDTTTHVASPVFDDPALDESGAVPSPDGARLAWVRGTRDGDLTVELVVSDPDGSNPAVVASCTMGCDFWDLDWQSVI